MSDNTAIDVARRALAPWWMTPGAERDAAAHVVSKLRPIIEAEVRERIAADIEAEFQHIATFGGAEPPAFMDAAQRSAYDLGYHDGAARIARGQS